ncbi:MAG: hypothetical protein ACXABE_16350, partial [Candidatus Thorarchaeota archaeon]
MQREMFIDIFENSPDILEQIPQGIEELHLGQEGIVEWRFDSQDRAIPKSEVDIKRFEMLMKWTDVSLGP